MKIVVICFIIACVVAIGYKISQYQDETTEKKLQELEEVVKKYEIK